MTPGRLFAIALPAAVAVAAGAAMIPLSANASAAGAHAGARPHAGGSPYAVYDCANKPQVRPGQFDIACDGADSLAKMRWTEWDGSRAVGSGVNWVNNCDPNCVGGKFSKQNVIVILWRPEAVRGHKGHFAYSKLTLLYPGSGRIQDGVPPGAF